MLSVLKRFKIIYILLLITTVAKAQTGSQRTLYIKQHKDTVFLDSFSIVPGSLIITKGNTLIRIKVID